MIPTSQNKQSFQKQTYKLKSSVQGCYISPLPGHVYQEITHTDAVLKSSSVAVSNLHQQKNGCFPYLYTIYPSTHPLAHGPVYSQMSNMVLSWFS